MRKESRDIAIAFKKGERCTRARTVTTGQEVFLHGHRIAWRNKDGSISLTLAGWGTVTTRDRLNTITDVLFGWRSFHQKKYVQYFEDDPVDPNSVITIHPVTHATM